MKPVSKALLKLAAVFCLIAVSYQAAAQDVDAELDWTGLHIVSFPLDGGVSRVHVRTGDRVGKGDKLVELNAEPIDIRIAQFEAELAAKKPVRADAKRDFEHARSLYEQTVLSDVELQRARHAFEAASAELAAARARLNHARWQKQEATAVAPFDAWVIARDVDSGQKLVAEQRSRPLLVLARADRMAAHAWLPPATLQALQNGQAVTVIVDDQEYAATVVSMGMRPEAADSDGRHRLAVEFQLRPGEVYRAGRGARISLP